MATDLLALTVLTPPGELGADVARRQRAAVRRAARLRRPARGVLRHARRVDAQAAGAPHRRLRGRARQPRAAHGAADARAAHPPREGDQQHLHGAGAAGGDGGHVRRLSRAARAQGHRRARRRPDGGAGARARAPRRCACATRPSSTPCASTAAAPTTRRWMQAAAARRINLRRLSSESLTIALDETTTVADDVERLWEVFEPDGKVRGAISVAALRARAVPVAPLGGRGGADERLPHAPGLQHAPLRDRDAALHAAARGARPVAHARR